MTVHPALSIGAIEGGPGSSQEWLDAVVGIGKQIMGVVEGTTSPLAVNVVYQIPGRYLEPEFEGVRSGTFSRKESFLVVQVALPMKPVANASDEVFAFLRDAVAVAEDFAYQEGMIEGELADVRELLDRL